jgi:nuclear GTP-binding protein
MVKSGEIQDPEARKMAQSRRAYYKELRKVVEASDVLIEVLDARDPEGCRNKEIEDQALKEGKKVILLVNKIDLVPPQNARMWQRYLRRELPTVLFKATTQTQSSNIATGATLHKKSLMQNSEMVEKMTAQSLTVGAENLLNVLKNYARVQGHGSAKQLITVGVVGFPNVGKSSVINSLKR